MDLQTEKLRSNIKLGDPKKVHVEETRTITPKQLIFSPNVGQKEPEAFESHRTEQSDSWPKKTITECIQYLHDQDNDVVFKQRLSNRLFSKLVVSEYCSLCLSMIGLCLNIIQHSMHRNPNYDEDIKTIIGVLDICCTVFLLPSIFIRYDIWL